MSTPYIGFTSHQTEKAPDLGPTGVCPNCGKECEIKESDPPLLQFISCCGKEYLVGIEGKDIQGTKPFCSGEVQLSSQSETE